jgi:uncharacterized protein DUF1634
LTVIEFTAGAGVGSLAIGFVRAGDWLYVGITTAVLGLLVYSLIAR